VRAIAFVVFAASCGGPCPTKSLGFSLSVYRVTSDDLNGASIAICHNGSCQVGDIAEDSGGRLVFNGALDHPTAFVLGPNEVTISVLTPPLVVGDQWRALVVDRNGVTRFDKTTTTVSDECDLGTVVF
jgi:hypothetical protein